MKIVCMAVDGKTAMDRLQPDLLFHVSIPLHRKEVVIDIS